MNGSIYKLLVIVFIGYPIAILHSMDLPAPELQSYDIPLPSDDEPIGGWIEITSDVGELFKQGDKVGAHQILKIPRMAQPVLILHIWQTMHENIKTLDDSDQYKILVLLAAKKLLLPIPPEPRDTSSTPNFDAYAKSIKDIFNQHTRSSATVQMAQNKRLAFASSEEDENWQCALL